MSLKFFSQALWPFSRQNKIGHNLDPIFSTSQKIVLSLSGGQSIFEDLQASRPRTSDCVLEDSTSGVHFIRHDISLLSTVLHSCYLIFGVICLNSLLNPHSKTVAAFY